MANRFMFGRKVKKNRTDTRSALVTRPWYGPAIVVGKEKNNVSCRGPARKVAPECVGKARMGDHDKRNSLVRECTR